MRSRFATHSVALAAACLLMAALAASAHGASFIGLGDLPGGAFRSDPSGVSADGSVVVGGSYYAFEQEPFRWTSGGGMVTLGGLPGGFSSSYAIGVSGDGSVVVGSGTTASGSEAFRWTSGGGMVALGDMSGIHSVATGVSTDGSVIVGYLSSQSNAWFRAITRIDYTAFDEPCAH